MIKSLHSFFTVLTLIGFTACSSLPISEDFQKNIVRGAKEKFFNNRDQWNAGEDSWRPLQDDALNKYINTVGQRLKQYTTVPFLNFDVIDTPVIQAISEEGRAIHVTLGMLNTIQNEAELACLLGHEIHHQEQYLKNPTHEKPHSFTKDLYDQFSPERVHGLGIRDDLEDISYSSYSKNQETEADEQGSLLCGKAGYDGYALSILQERIAANIKNGPLDKIKNLKGTHDELKNRSAHLRDWLSHQRIQINHGGLKAAEYARALHGIKSNKLNGSQKAALKSLADIGRNAEHLSVSTTHGSSIQEVVRLTDQLSRIVQKEKVTPQEIAKLSIHLSPGDHFMQERVISPFNRYASYHEQLVSGVFGALETLGRIVIGLTPLGAVIDLHDLVTGTDFFTGEKLSTADRALTALGLALGQGANLRALAIELKEARFLSAEGKLAFKEAEAISETRGINHAERFDPFHPGKLHEIDESSGKVADTFRSASYNEQRSLQPERLFRVQSEAYEGGELKCYWTRVKPESPTQSILDSALKPEWGNKATHWVEIEVPPGEQFFEGISAHQGGIVGGGNQIYIINPDPKWIVKQGKF